MVPTLRLFQARVPCSRTGQAQVRVCTHVHALPRLQTAARICTSDGQTIAASRALGPFEKAHIARNAALAGRKSLITGRGDDLLSASMHTRRSAWLRTHAHPCTLLCQRSGAATNRTRIRNTRPFDRPHNLQHFAGARSVWPCGLHLSACVYARLPTRQRRLALARRQMHACPVELLIIQLLLHELELS